MQNDYKIVSLVLKIAAITTLVIAAFLIVFPDDLLQWVDSKNTQNQHFAVYLGTALAGFSVMNWLYSRFHDLSVVLPALYGNLVSLGLAIVLDVVALSLSLLSKSAWVILVLHLIFAVAFIYCILLVRRHRD